jgi:hypothetical protein
MPNINLTEQQVLEESYRRNLAKGNEATCERLLAQIKAIRTERETKSSPWKPGERT